MTPVQLLQRLLLTAALLTAMPLLSQANEVPERADIPEQYKWDLTDMYADAEAWERDKERFETLLPTLSEYKGRLAESGATLLEALQHSESVGQLLGNLYVYAGLKSFEDTRDSDNAARFSQAKTLYSRYQEAMAYFSPELLAIPQTTLDAMVANTDGLAVYEHYLDEESGIRDNTLSEAEE